MGFKAREFAPVLCFLVIIPFFLSMFAPFVNDKLLYSNPKIAGTVSAISTWPANGAVLETRYPIGSYNFTTAIANVTWPPGYWDSANCLITFMGATYANTSVDAGLYNATYTFSNDSISGTDASFTTSSGTPAVVYTLAGHSMVYQYSTTGGNLYQAFSATHSTGTIAFWYYASAAGGNVIIGKNSTTAGAGGAIFNIYTSGTNFYYYYYSNASTSTLPIAFATNTWFHVTIEFDLAAQSNKGLLNVSVNGARQLTNVWKSNGTWSGSVLGNVYMANGGAMTTTIDALDYSWDSGYWTNRSFYAFLTTPFASQTEGSYAYQFTVWKSGTRYDCPAISFTVGQTDTLQLTSEAPYLTRWVFTDMSSGSWSNMYDVNFSREQYELTGVTSYTFNATFSDVSGDTYTSSSMPNTPYGTAQTIRSGTAYRGYLKFPSTYLTQNVTAGHLRIFNSPFPPFTPSAVDIYAIPNVWEESTLTWNTQLTLPGASIGGFTPTNVALDTFYAYFSDTTPIGSLCITGGATNPVFCSRDYSGGVYAPEMQLEISKKWNSSGLIYMQTNTSETLTLNSPILPSDLALVANDRITVVFNTTSSNEVDLVLKHAGVTVKSYSGGSALVSQSNTNYATQTKQFTLTDSIMVDQLEFTGTFDGTNLQITNITIDHPTFPQSTYDIGPYERYTGYLGAGTYTLTITYVDTGQTVQTLPATITSGIVSKFTYVPVLSGERVILYYESNGQPLSYADFYTNITRTLNNVTTKYLSSIDRFYADDGTSATLEIWDKFGNLLRNYSQIVDSFINVTLGSVYSVKLQNLMKYPSLITLSRNYSYPQYLAVGEVVEYQLYTGTYSLNYSNSELSSNVSVSLAIAGPLLYTLNTSYHAIYFSAFGPDLFGLGQDAMRLYINGTRKAWGPVELLGQWHNVTVLDYFNSTQYSAILDLANATEFNVFINYATVNLQNNYNFTTYCRITKNGVMLTNVMLQANWTTQFRFTTGTYLISFYYGNGTKIEDDYTDDVTFTLAANDSQLVSFGYYNASVPSFSFFGIDLLDLIVIIAITLGLTYIALYRSKGKVERQYSSNLLPRSIIPASQTTSRKKNETMKLIKDDRSEVSFDTLYERGEEK